MTDCEVTEFVENCEKSNEKPFGYMVVAISKEDLANHLSNEKFDLFMSLPEDERKAKLSEIADALNDKFENEYFGSLFEDVLIEKMN